jgi:hypothetical protein
MFLKENFLLLDPKYHILPHTPLAPSTNGHLLSTGSNQYHTHPNTLSPYKDMPNEDLELPTQYLSPVQQL